MPVHDLVLRVREAEKMILARRAVLVRPPRAAGVAMEMGRMTKTAWSIMKTTTSRPGRLGAYSLHRATMGEFLPLRRLKVSTEAGVPVEPARAGRGKRYNANRAIGESLFILRRSPALVQLLLFGPVCFLLFVHYCMSALADCLACPRRTCQRCAKCCYNCCYACVVGSCMCLVRCVARCCGRCLDGCRKACCPAEEEEDDDDDDGEAEEEAQNLVVRLRYGGRTLVVAFPEAEAPSARRVFEAECADPAVDSDPFWNALLARGAEADADADEALARQEEGLAADWETARGKWLTTRSVARTADDELRARMEAAAAAAPTAGDVEAAVVERAQDEVRAYVDAAARGGDVALPKKKILKCDLRGARARAAAGARRGAADAMRAVVARAMDALWAPFVKIFESMIDPKNKLDLLYCDSRFYAMGRVCRSDGRACVPRRGAAEKTGKVTMTDRPPVVCYVLRDATGSYLVVDDAADFKKWYGVVGAGLRARLQAPAGSPAPAGGAPPAADGGGAADARAAARENAMVLACIHRERAAQLAIWSVRRGLKALVSSFAPFPGLGGLVNPVVNAIVKCMSLDLSQFPIPGVPNLATVPNFDANNSRTVVAKVVVGLVGLRGVADVHEEAAADDDAIGEDAPDEDLSEGPDGEMTLATRAADGDGPGATLELAPEYDEVQYFFSAWFTFCGSCDDAEDQ